MRAYWQIVGFTAALMVVLTSFSAGQATSGSVTVASSTQGSMTRHVIDWTADASGNVVYEGITSTGYLRQVEILSSDETYTSPTTGWDLEILNDMRRDILEGAGANVNTTTTAWSSGEPTVAFPILNTPASTSTNQVFGLVFGRLTLNVTNAGAVGTPTDSVARKGRVALYFDRYN